MRRQRPGVGGDVRRGEGDARLAAFERVGRVERPSVVPGAVADLEGAVVFNRVPVAHDHVGVHRLVNGPRNVSVRTTREDEGRAAVPRRGHGLEREPYGGHVVCLHRSRAEVHMPCRFIMPRSFHEDGSLVEAQVAFGGLAVEEEAVRGRGETFGSGQAQDFRACAVRVESLQEGLFLALLAFQSVRVLCRSGLVDGGVDDVGDGGHLVPVQKAAHADVPTTLKRQQRRQVDGGLFIDARRDPHRERRRSTRFGGSGEAPPDPRAPKGSHRGATEQPP
mmetsp:Transcript_16071/g.56164  ORF Transcript_16071/g.56164 Transcript_16071/m.56164 type:complete len:278 (+) Transcript_16071:173-1006(+)